jgi:hypothetical protein
VRTWVLRPPLPLGLPLPRVGVVDCAGVGVETGPGPGVEVEAGVEDLAAAVEAGVPGLDVAGVLGAEVDAKVDVDA